MYFIWSIEAQFCSDEYIKRRKLCPRNNPHYYCDLYTNNFCFVASNPITRSIILNIKSYEIKHIVRTVLRKSRMLMTGLSVTRGQIRSTRRRSRTRSKWKRKETPQGASKRGDGGHGCSRLGRENTSWLFPFRYFNKHVQSNVILVERIIIIIWWSIYHVLNTGGGHHSVIFIFEWPRNRMNRSRDIVPA